MWSIKNSFINSEAELKKYVSDEDIYLQYFGDFKLDTHYYCPFKQEANPSFIITYYKDKLVWRRFGLYDRPMGAVDFVKVLHNLTYYQAINKIYNDIYLNGLAKDFKTNFKQLKLDCAVRYSKNWYPWEARYFSNVFSKAFLESNNVFPCVGFYINGILWHSSVKNDPMYVFLHKDYGPNSYTVYRPLAENKSNKFRKQNINGHIIGLSELPPGGETLIITKSYKDWLLFKLLGYNCIAVHTERTFLPNIVMQDLKKRFVKIIVVFDNDETGVESSIEFTKMYGLKYWNVPKSCKDCKDPFNVSDIYGIEYFKRIFKI